MRLEAGHSSRGAAAAPARSILWLALIAGALGAACGPAGSDAGFTAARVVPDDGHLRLGAGSAERFGFGSSVSARDAHAGTGNASGAGSAAGEGGYTFETPAGWQVLPTSAMRSVNLAVTRDPRAECYLTVLAGTGGGLEANVDRWRAQMGLAPLTLDERARLERASLLGQPAVRVDFEGDYAGMGGVSGAAYRLVGLLAVDQGGSSFLKFVGPRAVVTAELAAFDALASTLRPRGPEHSTESAAGAPGGALVWTAPEHWERGAARPLREVTFHAGEVECYVAVLGGDGGGVRSNLDRWRAQMGAGPLGAAQLAELEHVPALGVRAALIEVEGDYRGMSGETVDGGALLGAVAMLETRTVFVKMIGPAADVQREAAGFLAFVQSLEVSR